MSIDAPETHTGVLEGACVVCTEELSCVSVCTWLFFFFHFLLLIRPSLSLL